MDIATELGNHRGFPMLYVSGELDLASEQLLNDRLARLIDHHQCALLHVNDVAYSDAASLAMFLQAKQVFNARGGTLAFVCCQTQVLRELEALGLLSQVDVFDELDDAADYLDEHCPGQQGSG